MAGVEIFFGGGVKILVPVFLFFYFYIFLRGLYRQVFFN